MPARSAARITSTGAARSGKKRPKAAAPCCTSTSRPSCAGTPAARSVRVQRVPPGAYTRSSAAARRPPPRPARSGSSGSGSVSLRPRGVALIATSGWSAPRAGSARAPALRAQSLNARARAASRDTTCRSALAVAAATATARAAPPVPITSQRPPPSAPPPSCRSAVRIAATSVLSPTRLPRSVQNVLHAPTRAHRSVFRARHRSVASLCGTVTFPAPPSAGSTDSSPGRAAAGVGRATYTAFSPSARIAALCITGESEWATGSPSTTNRRVSALTSTRELFDDALHGRLDQSFELGAGVAVHAQVAAERIAHFRLVALPSGVLAQHEHATLAAELVHARPVVPRHGEHQVGAFDQLARQRPRAVSREIEPALESDQIGSFGDGRAVPGTGSRRRHREALAAAPRERALEQRCGERAAADVAGTDQENAFRLRLLGSRG